MALNASLKQVETVAAIQLHPILCLNDPYKTSVKLLQRLNTTVKLSRKSANPSVYHFLLQQLW